jgi:hypothetical protein
LQKVVERSVIVCETESFSVDETWISQQATVSGASQFEPTDKLSAQEKQTIGGACAEVEDECQDRVEQLPSWGFIDQRWNRRSPP